MERARYEITEFDSAGDLFVALDMSHGPVGRWRGRPLMSKEGEILVFRSREAARQAAEEVGEHG